MVGGYKIIFFSSIFLAGTANAGFLTAEKFPTTVNDVSFSDRMENKAAGYAPYKDASAYMHIQLQTLNDALADEVERIEKEHEIYCMGPGATKAECRPYVPDATVATQQAPSQNTQQNASNNANGAAESQPTPPPSASAPAAPTTPQSPTGAPGTYCATTHPHIPRGQTLPLGVPVSPDLDIYDKAQRGLVCSGFAVNRGGGHTHQGNDLGCNKKYFDSPIFATADGVVSIVKPDNPQSTAGNYIVIKHADGFESWYMHLNSILVTQGQRVQAGCQIGTMGYTGGSLGLKKQGKPFRMGIDITHLHYELHNTNHASTMNTPKGPIKLKYGRNKAFDPIDALKYK
ncbi:MAG: M23 family metallopeptidase [Alphaproteobacteria bacterium]|nr:M23 family metallopeptidase [Alphaproteobacteria bacterium]